MTKQVLLDENLPQRLRLLLAGHTVATTAYQGWAGKSNGALIAAAEEANFEVLLTADQKLSYQQNMQGRKLALIVMSTNKQSLVIANAPRILLAVNAAQPGSFSFLDIGH